MELARTEFDKLPLEIKKIFLDKGKVMGYDPEKIKNEYNMAQRKIRGNKTPWAKGRPNGHER